MNKSRDKLEFSDFTLCGMSNGRFYYEFNLRPTSLGDHCNWPFHVYREDKELFLAQIGVNPFRINCSFPIMNTEAEATYVLIMALTYYNES